MFKVSKITVGTFLLTLKISITCRNKNDKNDSAIRVMKERAKALQTFYEIERKESSKETKSI